MNKYKLITYLPSGIKTEEIISSELTTDVLQEKVGGYITSVPHTKKEAYVNEEGLLLGYEPNYIGSKAIGSPTLLVGNVVVVEKLK